MCFYGRKLFFTTACDFLPKKDKCCEKWNAFMRVTSDWKVSQTADSITGKDCDGAHALHAKYPKFNHMQIQLR